ncbi:MAG: tyrosine-type recombinase/integrase [Thermoleophilia bacterium]
MRLQLDRGGGRVPRVRDAGERFLDAVAAGKALSRSGTPYRETTIRGYQRELRGRVYPAIGDKRLDEVNRGDVLALSGGMQGEGLAPTTVRNVIVPLRALYRWAADHDITARNPTRGLAMPGVSGSRRERFATPQEVRALLAALDPRDRALWATAAFAGLRRGELMGLRWSDVDLDAGTIRVEQAYSPLAKRMGPPKTKAGRRTVPIAAALAEHLAAHRELSRPLRAQLVFARGTLADATRGNRGDRKAPFSDSTVCVRAQRVWRAAGLEPLGLHEARHTFASSMLAAGVAMKSVSALMGHTTIAVTVDLYGHLLPGAGADAIAQLDRFLAQ